MADDRTPQYLPHVDVAGYVLGTLTPEETAAFEAHLRGCAQCGAEVAELGSLPSLLVRTAPRPPADLRHRTMQAIAAQGAPPAAPSAPAWPAGQAWPAESVGPAEPVEPAGSTDARPVVTPLRPRRSRAVRWLGAAAAALLVVAAIGVGVVLFGPDRGEPTTTVALVGFEGAPGQGEALVRDVEGGREVRLKVTGLPANEAGTFYECWLVGPSDTPQAPSRISVGTFTVGADGTADVVWVSAADPALYPKMGVTLEPDNGDPGANGPKLLVSQ